MATHTDLTGRAVSTVKTVCDENCDESSVTEWGACVSRQ